jgi:hypothetical protein
MKGTCSFSQIYKTMYSTGVLAFANAISNQIAVAKRVGGKLFAKISYLDDTSALIDCKAGIDTFSDISFVRDGSVKLPNKIARSSELINMKTANLTKPQQFETITLKVQTDFEPNLVSHKFYVLSPRDFPSGEQKFDFIIGNDYFETIDKKIVLSTV